MIYLFEDRKYRMKTLLEGKAKIDEKFITVSKTIDCSKSELETFFKNLGDFDGVFIHSSYKFSDESIILNDVKNLLKSMNKFVVEFSGGASDSVLNENKHIICNSGTFYENLALFTNSYKKGEVILPLFIFGNNGYLKNQLKQFQKEALTTIYLEEDIRKILVEIIDHLDYIKSDLFIKSKDKFDSWLNNQFNNPEISKESLTKLIEKFCDYESY
ncbi:hypothetical protein G1K57_04535 [Tenacibaculum finnmarkense]|uniref:hypothetical protein n=1 Tax=Tenacibaculum finnmarkense TaxID=2781243 RepID=UPI001EFC05B2|nr:hypothetical protein [Tenacibaculum finnmarkense]MCG8807433.1 hypothetical protein [Tenacibaculum finnmarkense]MCG8817652.1 hypothetical protein [Tenacibaculum finnmarkense]